jgi:hypothetical protein
MRSCTTPCARTNATSAAWVVVHAIGAAARLVVGVVWQAAAIEADTGVTTSYAWTFADVADAREALPLSACTKDGDGMDLLARWS